jgi:hypothetical protein
MTWPGRRRAHGFLKTTCSHGLLHGTHGMGAFFSLILLSSVARKFISIFLSWLPRSWSVFLMSRLQHRLRRHIQINIFGCLPPTGISNKDVDQFQAYCRYLISVLEQSPRSILLRQISSVLEQRLVRGDAPLSELLNILNQAFNTKHTFNQADGCIDAYRHSAGARLAGRTSGAAPSNIRSYNHSRARVQVGGPSRCNSTAERVSV